MNPQLPTTPHLTLSALRDLATDLGFAHVGAARAERMEPEEARLEEWLNRGYQGQMGWMNNHFDKRVDPTKLVPGARSVISLSYNYCPADDRPSREAPKIARYAYGEDYHSVLRKQLYELVRRLEEKIGAPINGRVFVDSAPVLERDWARRAGTGWVGKNTLLINPKSGSYYFLAEIISDLRVEFSDPISDYCGSCTRCIDACPTAAISPGGYVVDGSKCISYLTIELREAIPEEFSERMEGWAFGCDICQEVCPWNRFSTPHEEPAFRPHPDLADMGEREWEEMTEEVFRRVFRKSAVKRAKYAGLRRNLDFLGTLLLLFMLCTCAPPAPPKADEAENTVEVRNAVLLTDSNCWEPGRLRFLRDSLDRAGYRSIVSGNSTETGEELLRRLPWLTQPGIALLLYDPRLAGPALLDSLRRRLPGTEVRPSGE